MPLAYYSVAAEREFWTEHWGGHSVDSLLAVARTSPLTELVTGALPPAGPVLEAGCGLGQYVILLRECGWRAIGVDWSVEALQACRAAAAVPLATMELRALALRSGTVAAYVSLGVVEHDPSGPDGILAEARRVLVPGGVLVVSVPYWNGARRLAAPYLRRRGQAVVRRGGRFYQYAFSRRELAETLGRHGFATRSLHPYDPARVLRRAWRTASGRGGREAECPALPGQGGGGASAAGGPTGPARTVRRLARNVLYSPPLLRLLGHMLLGVAIKR